MDIHSLLNGTGQSLQPKQQAEEVLPVEPFAIESDLEPQVIAQPEPILQQIPATYNDWLKQVLPADANQHWMLHLNDAALKIRAIIGAWNGLYVAQQTKEEAVQAVAKIEQICPVSFSVIMALGVLPKSLLNAYHGIGKPAAQAAKQPIGLLPYTLGSLAWLGLPGQSLLAADQEALQLFEIQFEHDRRLLEEQEIITSIHHPLACKHGIYCTIEYNRDNIPINMDVRVCTYGQMAAFARENPRHTILECVHRVYAILKAKENGLPLNTEGYMWSPFVMRAPRVDKGMPRKLRF